MIEEGRRRLEEQDRHGSQGSKHLNKDGGGSAPSAR